jgi:hypothetical protein
MLMAKTVAFSLLLLDTSCELHLPVVRWNIFSCPIFDFSSPSIIFFSSSCMSLNDLCNMELPSVTESPYASKSCGPNALLPMVPSHYIWSLELLQQEHCIYVIPFLIDYLWTEHISSSKIRLIGLMTFPWSFKFSTLFLSPGFLTQSVLQGKIVGLSPTLFCVASCSIVVQVTGVTDLPRDR